MVIFDYYKSIPKGLKKIFRKKISEKLEICDATVVYKINSGKWKTIEKQIVEDVIKELETSIMSFQKC